eukprot:g381.t1
MSSDEVFVPPVLTEEEKAEQSKAAQKIQAIQRGKQLRKERQEQAAAAKKMQALHRGRNARRSQKEKWERKMNQSLEDIFASGVSWGFHPLTGQPACVEVDLSKKHIKSIGLLPEKLPFLQKINVSHNTIGSLASFAGFKYLHSLDASHNKLRSCLEFCPKHFDDDDDCNDNVGSSLVRADLSYNKIKDTIPVKIHQYLRVLNLDNNKITSLCGFGNLQYLQDLSARNNNIESLENWFNGDAPKNLTKLLLDDNMIVRLEPIKLLKRLTTLSVKNNKIRSLYGLQSSKNLSILQVDGNRITSTKELEVLSNLKYLGTLNMSNTPVQRVDYYRWRVIYRLKSLEVLDEQNITAIEKVKAECAHGDDVKSRIEVWHDTVGADREFIQTVPVVHPPKELEEEELREGKVENSRKLVYRGRRPLCGEDASIDVYLRDADGSNNIECIAYSDSGSFELFSSYFASELRPHVDSINEGERLFFSEREGKRGFSHKHDAGDVILGIKSEDFAAALAHRLQIRGNEPSKTNTADLTNVQWSKLQEQNILVADLELVVQPPPVAVGYDVLYGMGMCIEVTHDIDSRILITACTLDNLRQTHFSVGYTEEYVRLSMADAEGLEPKDFNLGELYKAVLENCSIERPKGSEDLALMIPPPPPDGPTMELEIARKRAKKKWDQLDADGNGVLEGDELNGLAEWVWTAFHPGGKPISAREKAKMTRKLSKRIAQT